MNSINVESENDIVISGMAGVFPNSDHTRHFEENLFSKIDMTSDDNRRWVSDNPQTPKRFGKLNEINKFDNIFFNMMGNVSDTMDPMGRILLEKTYEAIIDAGYNPKEIKGTRTGVIIGVSYSDTEISNFSSQTLPSSLSIPGSIRSLLPNRISFWLDVHGPSYAIDTACSSTMFALEHAYKALKSGECESVVIGGSNICLHRKISQAYCQLGILCTEGRCKCFDESADGYARAEAVAVLFMQKRKNARRVYAKIVHSKTNCDGHQEGGHHHPSLRMQTELLREFYDECPVEPSELQFLEAHATGTKVGEPIEMKAVESILLQRRQEPLKIGSVKSNMGHSEPVSGLCSVVKVILSYESGYIMPNINLKKLRADIPALNDGKLIVVTEPTSWNGGLTAINSFGFGGANAHTVLDSNHKTKINHGTPEDDIPRLVLVSGRTQEAVDVMLNDLENRPLDAEYVALFHEIYKNHVFGHSYRGYTIIEKQEKEICRDIKFCPEETRPVWFTYAGVGSQWATMGRSLMRIPVIAESIIQCQRILMDKGVDLIEILTKDDATIFDKIANSYLGITAIQIALTDFLKVIEIEPDGIVGHSIGEFGCAYADGCLTLEETILLAYYRGQAFIESKSITGLMAAIGLGAKDVKNMLPADIDIACHNGPDSCTISGPSDQITKFLAIMEKENVFAKVIESSNVPLHSRYVTDIGKRFFDKAKLILSKPKLRSKKWFSSTYTEDELTAEASNYASAEYFARNIVGTVYFEEVCQHVPNNAIVIEIAPHGLLQAILKRSLNKDVTNIPLTNKRLNDNGTRLLAAVGEMYEAGLCPQISKLYPPVQFPVSKGTPSISPLVRWDHSRDWFVFGDEDTSRIKRGQRTVRISLKDDEQKYLAGHMIRGRILYPACGYLVLAWETFSQMNGTPITQTPVKFTNVRLLRSTTVPDREAVQLEVSIFKNTGDFEISEQGELVVTGKIFPFIDVNDEPTSDDYESPDGLDGLDYQMSPDDFYTTSELGGFTYLGPFRSIKGVHYQNINQTIAKISWCNNYVAFLDCLLQVLGLLRVFGQTNTQLPVSLKTVTINPQKHENILKTLDAKKPEFTAVTSLEPYEIQCGGITISNILHAPFTSSKFTQKCILENFEFVPYALPSLILDQAIRVCVQIILENTNSNEMKIIEVLSDDDVKGPLLSPLIDEAIEVLPLVQGEILIQADAEHPLVNQETAPGFEVQKNALTKDASAILITTSGALQKNETLTDCLDALHENGFILTKENSPVNESLVDAKKMVVCFQYRTDDDETFVLLRRKCPVDFEILSSKITNNFVEWVQPLQECISKMTADQKLIIYAEKEPFNGILGFYNCLKKEQPHHNICCFFMMDDDAPPFDPEHSFYANQLAKNLKVNVRKNGRWGSYHHLPLPESTLVRSKHKFLNLRTYGDLSSLQWFDGSLDPDTYVPDNDNKKLVLVECAALNFRDIMIATGKMDPTSIFKDSKKDCMVGMEFAGRLLDGRRVMGMVESAAITNFLEVSGDYLWPVPDEWTLHEAVTVPVVYATVLYALLSCGPLKRGTSILIHCGAGGVGIAAINVCLHYGCEIFTTVGSEEKRQFIRTHFPSIPDSHIGNSRDCSFERMVKYATNGEGVDLVLNSLAEEKLEASVRCVRAGGRFMEIGKYDMIINNKLELRPFLKGIMFQTIDLTNLLVVRDKRNASVLFSMINDALKEGIIKPLPQIVYNADDAEKAFRYMASGKHIGKIILKIQEDNSPSGPETPLSDCHSYFTCFPDKSYVLCGGLGGFGIELADWLVNRGARKLILTSRSGLTNGHQTFRLKTWQSKGVNVVISMGDISDKAYVKQLLEQANSIGPVSGIFNLAVVIDDSIFENQTVEYFENSARPKANATALLDQLSREMCPELDHFVVYSSVACGMGTISQTNYAMSNSIMERICESRKSANLPALAIEFGPIGGVGIFVKTIKKLSDARASALGSNSEEQFLIPPNFNSELFGGYQTQMIESCVGVHDSVLRQNNAVVLSMVVAEKSSTNRKSRNLSEAVAYILGIKNIKSINTNASLPHLGMDSMANAEIREILRREWNMTLTLPEVAALTFNKLKEIEKSLTGKDRKTYVEKNDADIGISDYIYESLMSSHKYDLTFVENIIECQFKFTDGEIEMKPKVFVCPGLDGVGEAWPEFDSKFAARMYILQYRYVNPDTSISQIAKPLFDEVTKQLSLEEPFYIIGASFGVYVALELVKLLEKEGRIGLLWILDYMGLVKPEDANNKGLVPNDHGKVMNAITEGVKKFFLHYRDKFPNTNVEKSESHLNEFLEVLGLGKDEQIQIIEEKLRATPTGVVPPIYAVWGARAMAALFHEEPVDGSIKASCTLIRTPKTDSDTIDDYGISRYFVQPLKIHFVKGNNFTVYKKKETKEIIFTELSANWDQYLQNK